MGIEVIPSVRYVTEALICYKNVMMYRGKDYVSDLRIEAIWKTKEILVMFQYLLPRSLPKKSKWVDTFTVNRTRYHKQSVIS